MSLRLTDRDIAALAEASAVLLRPFDYPSGEAWQRAACAAVQRALDGYASSLALSAGGSTSFGGEPDTVRVLETILPLPEWARTSLGADRRRRQLRVANWSELFDESMVKASSFYNDAVRPHQLLAPLTMMEDVTAGELPAALTVYFKDERDAAPHVLKRKKMLNLLYPSFSAGVKAYVCLANSKSELLKLAETSREGVLVYDGRGHLLYENASVGRILASDPERERVRREVAFSVRRFAARHDGRSEITAPSAAPRSEVRTSTGRYDTSMFLFERGWISNSEGIAVILMPAKARTGSVEEAMNHYRLSRRESETARLLCRGLSSRQIAAVLAISVNTARRHTESLFAKLGVHSRMEAAAVLSSTA